MESISSSLALREGKKPRVWAACPGVLSKCVLTHRSKHAQSCCVDKILTPHSLFTRGHVCLPFAQALLWTWGQRSDCHLSPLLLRHLHSSGHSRVKQPAQGVAEMTVPVYTETPAWASHTECHSFLSCVTRHRRSVSVTLR